jgi:chemotaxis protein MotB
MLDNKDIDPARIVVQGYADTQLLVKNNSAENRARNRRVEVIIVADTPISGP